MFQESVGRTALNRIRKSERKTKLRYKYLFQRWENVLSIRKLNLGEICTQMIRHSLLIERKAKEFDPPFYALDYYYVVLVYFTMLHNLVIPNSEILLYKSSFSLVILYSKVG